MDLLRRRPVQSSPVAQHNITLSRRHGISSYSHFLLLSVLVSLPFYLSPSLVKETIYTFFPCTSHGRFEPPFQLAQPGETSHTLPQTGPPPSNTIEVVVAFQPHFILLLQTQHHQHAVPASTQAIRHPHPPLRHRPSHMARCKCLRSCSEGQTSRRVRIFRCWTSSNRNRIWQHPHNNNIIIIRRRGYSHTYSIILFGLYERTSCHNNHH